MAWSKRKPYIKSAATKFTTVKKYSRLEKGSPQQEMLWDTLVNTDKHVMVGALAGTGKTSSSIEGLHRLREVSKHRRMATVAFNKSISLELQEKVPEGVEAGTLHSFGLKACKYAYGNRLEVDFDKVANFIQPALEAETRIAKLQYAYSTVIRKTVSLIKNLCLDHLEFSEKDLMLLYGKYGYESDDVRVLPEVVVDIVKSAVSMCITNTKTVDFDDMLWLPVIHQLPMTRFDLLVVDESQDLNRVQQKMLANMSNRYMIVGDENQAIYYFRGADSYSMRTMLEFLKSRGDTVELPLTFTRRCPKTHVAEAKKLVPSFDAFLEAPEGLIDTRVYDKALKDIGIGDLVICRTNAPMCFTATRLLRNRVPVKIPGADLKGDILGLFNRIQANSISEFISGLGTWFSKQAMRMENDPSRLRNLEEKYQCTLAFTEGADTIEDAKRAVNAVFINEEQRADSSSVVTCSSVHRAKGLEADNVWILMPEKMPAAWAKSEEEQKQEMNVKYVALTRSKQNMFYVPDWSKDN